MADNVDDFDRLPGAAFDHRQEDSPQLTYLPDRDLHLPVFLPNLRLPPPRPEPLLTATPNPWDLAPAPGSFLEPSLLSFSPPRYSPELGGPDELSVPFQPGPLHSDLPDFASFGAQPDSRADGYTSPRAGASPRTSRGSRHRHPPAALPTATHIHDTNEISISNPTAAFTTLPQQSAHNTPATYETEHLPPLYTPPKMSARKRNSTADVPPSSSPSAPVPKKRRRTSGASQPKSDPLERAESDNESDIIDLRDLSKVPELLLQRQREKAERVKLGSFQCAICMDDATTLTVTHCGHLFCADCLTTALQTEAQRHKCPICRQKIESKPREAYKASTKGYWPLELKLMTTTRKGKKADG